MSTVQTINNPQKKATVRSAVQRLMSIHWLMAASYLLLFVTGTTMFGLGADHYPLAILDFHMSMGVLVIGLLTYRILTLLQVSWQKYTQRAPRFTTRWFGIAALHSSLYLLMWVVPFTGVFLANTAGSDSVKFFGFLLPDLFPVNEALVPLAGDLHFWFAYSFLALIVLHIVIQRKALKTVWKRVSNWTQSAK